MSFLEEYGLSGILADDMGLGKTLQTLCLLAMKIYRKPQAKVSVIFIICTDTIKFIVIEVLFVGLITLVSLSA